MAKQLKNCDAKLLGPVKWQPVTVNEALSVMAALFLCERKVLYY